MTEIDGVPILDLARAQGRALAKVGVDTVVVRRARKTRLR